MLTKLLTQSKPVNGRWLPALVIFLLFVSQPAQSDDTDIYLDPSIPTGAEPLVMFSLDYRSNLTATVCNGDECNDLRDEGYLGSGSVNFFKLLRAVLKKVLDPLDGVKVGFMLNHDDSCTGNITAGPTKTKCSNGGYILSGFHLMDAGSDDVNTYQEDGEDPDKLALFQKLDAIPDPQGNVSHSYQGKELFFEFFRYLTGQDVYNGHLGYTDFGDSNKNTNLDEGNNQNIAWDSDIETDSNVSYQNPLAEVGECASIFTINFMFQVSNQEDDSDDAITASQSAGGMSGINLSGNNNSFDTVIEWLNDVDLADGTFGTVGALDGKQNVTSYFLVDPTKLNVTTNGYANAGGTGVALALSDDPATLIATLNNIFSSILSVSTTFVAPSIPVNVFNRSQIVNEVFMAIFEADESGYPFWNGNLKKLRIASNSITGELELQDINGDNAIDIDGRIKRDAVTYWTDSASLPAPGDDEVSGADGRAVARGGAGQQIPGYVSETPNNTNAEGGGRTLYTEDSSDADDGLMALDSTAEVAESLWAEITEDWNPAASDSNYSGASNDERDKALHILRWARGLDDSGTAARSWILGDPLHSRPRPINYGGRSGYDMENPDIRILMGTNDGAMHMFRNTMPSSEGDTEPVQDGSEVWAFVPREIIPLLDRLRSNSAGAPVHPVGVDGSPSIYTYDDDGDGNLEAGDDKVYAYFGLRRGGKVIYAIDISDPDTPKFMWKIEKGVAGSDFAELAQSWSQPQLGSILVGGVKTPILIFAGGYNGDDDGDDIGDLGKDAKNRSTRTGATPSIGTDDDEGNALFVINAETGALIWKAVYGVTEEYDDDKKAYYHPRLLDSIPAAVTAIDSTGNGYTDRVYFGDTGGVVWRADFAGYYDHDNAPETEEIIGYHRVQDWTLTQLISVGRHVSGHSTIADDRRFFNSADVVLSRDDAGPFDAVLIGSGDREDPNGTDVTNQFYMIKDRYVTSGSPPSSTLNDNSLVDLTSNCLQTSDCDTNPDLTNGWKVELTNSGEKNLASAVVLGGQVFFTTFSPASSTSSCELNEGKGRLYALSLTDATAIINFDSTNDTDGVTYERIDELASGGIPVQVVPLSEGKLLVQGQEAGANIVDTNVRTGYKTYWYEVYK